MRLRFAGNQVRSGRGLDPMPRGFLNLAPLMKHFHQRVDIERFLMKDIFSLVLASKSRDQVGPSRGQVISGRNLRAGILTERRPIAFPLRP